MDHNQAELAGTSLDGSTAPIYGYFNHPDTRAGYRLIGFKIRLDEFTMWMGSDHPYMHLPMSWLEERLKGKVEVKYAKD